MHRKVSKGWMFLAPSLIGVSIFLFLPFLDVIRRSFYANITGAFVGLKNYSMIFGNGAFKLAAWNTFRFCIVCVPILVVLSLAIAVFLGNAGKIGSTIKSGFLMPMAIPVASIVLVWQMVFANSGLLNGLLSKFGVTGPDWMNSGYAFGVLVFSYVWKNLGYDIILWMAGLSGISQNIYEAAKVDGAGAWQCFRYITMPNMVNSLFVIVVLSLLNSFKVFREAYLVAGAYPNESIYLLQHTFNNWFQKLEVDKMTAAAVVLGAVLFVLILIFQKLWGRKNNE